MVFTRKDEDFPLVVLMVQKSSFHQLRLVVYLSMIYRVWTTSKRWLFGISEPSTVWVHKDSFRARKNGAVFAMEPGGGLGAWAQWFGFRLDPPKMKGIERTSGALPNIEPQNCQVHH